MKEFLKRTVTWILLAVTFGGAYLHSQLLFAIFLGVIFLIVLTTEWPRLLPFEGVEGVLFSLLYPGIPIVATLALHILFYATDFYLPLYPFAIAWGADTGGYVLGKLMGWHKVCPSISPGKSWEGLVGSLIAVLVLNWLLLPRIEASFAAAAYSASWPLAIGFAAALTAIAFLGGVFLSVLKRRKNLKDAGNILPGHGGFLDRFDSVFAVVVALWIMLIAPSLAGYWKQMTARTPVQGMVTK